MRGIGVTHNPLMRHEAFSVTLMIVPTWSLQYRFWNELAVEITVPTALTHPA